MSLERFNKNQSWLANQLGVYKQAVSFWAAGLTSPRKEIREKIAELFNIDRDSLESLLYK